MHLNPPNSITLRVRHLGVKRKGKAILTGITFAAVPGQFVGIIGPNGAGKTTLLRAIAGERPTTGQVLLNDQDLYHAPAYWLPRVGYVPVDNVLHEQLTILQALRFIGRLRAPDLARAELESRIDKLLAEFGFGEHDERRQRALARLSSGERKRVNICAELLTEPALLLLDEPTSNLDPNAELELMQMLRQRAKQQNQTVVLVTHTLNTIGECDHVIFIENAEIRATGEPGAVLPQLEREGKIKAEGSDFYRWAEVFEHYQTDEALRTAKQVEIVPASVPAFAQPHTSSALGSFWHQLGVLLQRYFQIRLNEPLVLILTLALGLIGGFFLFVLPTEAFIRPEDLSDNTRIVAARQAVFILSVVVTLIGLIASFREISKEARIYSHERLKGVIPLAYILSKWVWLAVAVGVMAPLGLMVMLILQQPFPDMPVDALTVKVIAGTTLILTCIAALSLGLALSALAYTLAPPTGAGNVPTGNSDNVATILLALVLVFNVLLSGLVRNPTLEDIINHLSVFATTHWAFEGFSASMSYYCWASIKMFSEFNSFGHLAAGWLSLILYMLIALALAVIVLHMRDPWATAQSLVKLGQENLVGIALFVGVLAALMSWTLFLGDQSTRYHDLTFFDRFYGGIRFARVENVPRQNSLQEWVGLLSQSQCGEVD